MKKGGFSHFTPHVQFLMIFIIIITSFIAIFPLGILLLMPFTEAGQVMHALEHGAPVAFLKHLQVVQSFAIFIIPALVAAYLFSTRPINWLWFRSTKWPLILLTTATIVAVQPMVAWLAQWNSGIEFPAYMQGFQEWVKASEADARVLIFKFLDTTTIFGFLFNLFMIAVLPSIGEEMLFRGTIQPVVQKWSNNKHLAVWLTAILFSAMHMQFLTFAPRLLLGAMLGYLLVYGGSLWYPILAHFINNFMA